MRWQRSWEVQVPGVYLAKHDDDLIGNSWLIFVESSLGGFVFGANKQHGYSQKLDCPGNTHVFFFGPIPQPEDQ